MAATSPSVLGRWARRARSVPWCSLLCACVCQRLDVGHEGGETIPMSELLARAEVEEIAAQKVLRCSPTRSVVVRLSRGPGLATSSALAVALCSSLDSVGRGCFRLLSPLGACPVSGGHW